WEIRPLPIRKRGAWSCPTQSSRPGGGRRAAGGAKTGARVGHRQAKETKSGGQGGRKSDHLMVPEKPGNQITGTRRRDGGDESRSRWRETWQEHRILISCQRNANG